MEAPNQKVIDTSGHNGQPGADNWEKRPVEAPIGQAGAHGQYAGHPTAGTPGQDIRVRLAYAEQEPDTVQVAGEGPHTGSLWKVLRNERILLKASGGYGGAGGRGQDGQAGGRGRDGRNATKHHAGGDGEPGAAGGHGGFGTNGAPGAAGGNVFITVHEDDTDLLMPIDFDVSGGAGGKSGQHGEPGDGGIGGRGGDGHVWTEKSGNTVSAHAMPGGSNGSNGSPGMRPNTYLEAGQSGPNGSIQITVISGDLSQATFPGAYKLEVSKFDIIDENEDGVNEPGEHLLVHNIRVRNVGGMPSPVSRSIQVLIQGTPFLEPISAEPLQLPFGIQPGQEVEVPGVLRAYIRNEWQEKPLGYKLDYLEQVTLVAFFNQRLNRPLPFFSGSTPIKICYPLTLDAPTYLDCVAKGDKVRFKWVLHNNSNKAYGLESVLRRGAATRLTDPTRLFTLIHATAENPGVATDELPCIEPQSKITIDQDFSVDERTMEFSEGNLTLELMLSDPKTGAMRSVQKHGMHMQISGVYSLSERPSFLLVINSKTPNYAIHQLIHLIRFRMHTQLDIFNLSLHGSYDSPVTGEHVFRSYEGLSIVIFGNTFPYFNKVYSDPWTLLDQFQTATSLKRNTNILFASVTNNLQGLKDWVTTTIYPVFKYDKSSGAELGVRSPDAKSMAISLKSAHAMATEPDEKAHQLTVTKSLFKSAYKNVLPQARKTAKNLDKHLPLKRFAAFPDAQNAYPNKYTMGIIVCEGVPKTANLLVSMGEFPPSVDGSYSIADYHMLFIVACIPFEDRTKIFWNAVGQDAANGLLADVVYAGLEHFYTRSPGSGAMIDPKILEAISLSLQWNMTNELHQFVSSRPRFPDPLSIDEKLQQLSQVSFFLKSAPSSIRIHDAKLTPALIGLLAALHVIANPLTFWQATKTTFAFVGNRKGQLTPHLNRRIDALLASICAANAVDAVRAQVLVRSKQLKADITSSNSSKKQERKSYAPVARAELARFAGMQAGSVQVVALGSEMRGSRAMELEEFERHVGKYCEHTLAAQSMGEDAKALLREMVNPVDEVDE